MDFSKFKTPDWLMIGGAVGIFVAGFLPWAEAFGESGAKVFDFLWTGFVPWELILGAAIVVVLVRLGLVRPQRVPVPLVLLVMCATAAILLFVRLVFNPGLEGVSAGIGMILSFVASLISLGGAAWGFLQATGKLPGGTTSQPHYAPQPQYAPQGQYQQGQHQHGQYQPGQPQPGQYQPGQYPAQPGQPGQPGQYPSAQPGWSGAPGAPQGQPGQHPTPPPPPPPPAS